MNASRLKHLVAASAGLLAVAAVGSVAQAADPVSLEGKVITIISGSGPGGTVDAMARSFAQFVPKYVPGAPRAIVQNIEGQGQLRGAQTAQRAKPDGTTLGIFSPRWTTRYLLGDPVEGVDFDNTKFVGTYRTDRRTYMGCVRRDVATSWDDLKKSGKRMITGVPELGGTWDAVWQWLDNNGHPVRVLSGYSGEAELNFAISRGELNAHPKCQDRVGAFPDQYPEWKKEFWAPIFFYGTKTLDEQALAVVKEMGFPPPPYLWDIVPPPDPVTRAAFEVQDVAATYSSAIFLPPGTADAVHQMWLKAFDDIGKDPEFVAVATKAMGMVPNAGNGVEIRKTFTDFIGDMERQGIRDQVRKRFENFGK